MTLDDALPSGWTKLRLGELFIRERRGIDPSQQPDQTFELWSVPAFPSDAPEMVRGRDVRSSKQFVNAGDVLLCKINPRINRVWVVGEDRGLPQIASTEWIRLRAVGVDPYFLAHQLRAASFRERLCAEVSGVGGSLTRARPQAVASLEILVAPEAEQRRIVARLDLLLASSSTARAALNAVPGLLEQYQMSVLAAAFRGDLTSEWRRTHGPMDKGDIPFASTTHAGEREDMPALPSTWRYSPIERVAADGTVVTYGIVLPGPNMPDGVPYVRQQDIEDGRVRIDALGRTTPAIAARHERSALREGDVLLCIIRHLRVAVVPPGLDGANLTQGTVRIRPAPFIASEYLAAYLSSPAAQQWMKRCYIGMAMPRINVKDARAVPVAVPPLAEQREIVRLVSEAVHTVERQLNAVRLMQLELRSLEEATLAKAFRGELVPQEPMDVPATAHPGRVESARVAEPSARRARRSTGAVRRT